MKNLSADSVQLEAINHRDGACMVLAGPGSGKTFIITHRIFNLIDQFKVNPSKILVITFTKAAATEMKNRFLSLSGSRGNSVFFGTFHSAFYNFLHLYYRENLPGIINEGEKRKIIVKILKSNPIYKDNPLFDITETDELINSISYYKSTDHLIDPVYPLNLFINFYSEYEKSKEIINKIDYDDILIKCRDMLIKKPEIREKIRNFFEYILIDEFQDINKIQYEIVKLISNDKNNVFIVGDDDQSIYGFRGASGLFMKKFSEDYKNVKVIELVKNYRSKESIINSANRLISHNSKRLKTKDIITADDKDKGIFDIISFSSQNDENERIREIISENTKENRVTAILQRTNKDVAYYKSIFGVNDFKSYETVVSTIYDYIMAYISFVINNDRTSMLKILDTVDLIISRNIFVKETVDLNSLVKANQNSVFGSELNVLKRKIELISKLEPYPMTTYLFNVCKLKEIFKNTPFSLNEKYVDTCVSELINASKKLKNYKEYSDYLKKRIPNRKKTEESLIKIMTFHGSKGLEFDTVIIPDAIEGVIPGRASLIEGNDEEERRLMYVAMTRAINKLYIFSPKKEGSTKALPSRFIKDIYDSSNSKSSRYSSYLSNTFSSSSSSSI